MRGREPVSYRTENGDTVEVYPDSSGTQWRWRRRSPNNRTVSDG